MSTDSFCGVSEGVRPGASTLVRTVDVDISLVFFNQPLRCGSCRVMNMRKRGCGSQRNPARQARLARVEEQGTLRGPFSRTWQGRSLLRW